MRWLVWWDRTVGIKVALEHRTSYTFDRPVRVFPHVVRLRPAPHSRTAIEAYSLRVEPADHFINWQQDAVGNFVYRLTFPNPMSRLTITVGLIADLKVINPFDFFIEDWAETCPPPGFTYPYLVQLASAVKALDGPSGPAADFTDLHAWAEVYIPGAGWIGLDPTSGLFAGEGHIPLAATPHPASAAPISGGIDPCESVLEFSNTVTRIHEDPRVTLPYTDEAWQTICAVGQHVDERLAAGDARLTIGGEPTFVSVDNQVDEEWTTAADGPHKRRRASDLAARLKAAWAPHGLIQRGQGRCYPGEPLPRWQIALYWRADGQPLWTDDTLLADPWGTDSTSLPADNAAAYQLVAGIADGLGLPLSQVRP